MNLPIAAGNFFHNGYVVRSVDAVMASLKTKLAIANWKVIRLGEGYASNALAYAYSRGVLVELVEVNLQKDPIAIHRDFIPEADDQAVLNHVAYLVDDPAQLQELIADVETAGLSIAWRSAFRDVFTEYCYVDTVSQLGHFCEFACLGPAGRDFLADIPRN